MKYILIWCNNIFSVFSHLCVFVAKGRVTTLILFYTLGFNNVGIKEKMMMILQLLLLLFLHIKRLQTKEDGSECQQNR